MEQLEQIREPGQWCSPEKAETLACMILALRPKTVVEIGIWRGGSFLPMALAMKELASDEFPRKIIGIDSWDPKTSEAGQDPINAEWWASADHETAYRFFRGRLEALKIPHVVLEWPIGGPPEICEIWHCSSSSPSLPTIPRIDLLHVDGNHAEQAVKDVKRFVPRVPVGGIVILDDIGWTGGHVGLAAQHLLDEGFLPLFDLAPGRVFQRTQVVGHL